MDLHVRLLTPQFLHEVETRINTLTKDVKMNDQQLVRKVHRDLLIQLWTKTGWNNTTVNTKEMYKGLEIPKHTEVIGRKHPDNHNQIIVNDKVYALNEFPVMTCQPLDKVTDSESDDAIVEEDY